VFENLIALCGNCHDMYDHLKTIDRKAMRGYKHNLGVLQTRYSDLERRLLEMFSDDRTETAVFQQDMAFPFHYLMQDGYLRLVHFERHAMSGPWVQGLWAYGLTDAGRSFLHRWVAGNEVD
jgi:hypothetical protein